MQVILSISQEISLKVVYSIELLGLTDQKYLYFMIQLRI